jgi:hypothetical protein
MVKEVEL